MQTPYRAFYRSRTDRMISGVAGGIGEYFGLDATLVRVLLAVGSLLGWIGPIGITYLILMVVVPERPEGYSSATLPPQPVTSEPAAVEKAAPAQASAQGSVSPIPPAADPFFPDLVITPDPAAAEDTDMLTPEAEPEEALPAVELGDPDVRDDPLAEFAATSAFPPTESELPWSAPVDAAPDETAVPEMEDGDPAETLAGSPAIEPVQNDLDTTIAWPFADEDSSDSDSPATLITPRPPAVDSTEDDPDPAEEK